MPGQQEVILWVLRRLEHSVESHSQNVASKQLVEELLSLSKMKPLLVLARPVHTPLARIWQHKQKEPP